MVLPIKIDRVLMENMPQQKIAKFWTSSSFYEGNKFVLLKS